MFEYNICNVYDEDVFEKQCLALERHIPNLLKKQFSEDIDGTQLQQYVKQGEKLRVINDKLVRISIISEFKIERYFDNGGTA